MKNEFIKRFLSSIILIPVSFIFIIKGSIFLNFFLIICFLITVNEWFNMIKKNLIKFIGLIFLIFSFYSIYKIRNDFDRDFLYLLFVLITCVSTDIGGYVFGNIFGGPKLIKISPNKTYSGSVGSYIFSFIFSYFFLVFENIDYSIKILILVFFVSTISQIGDILISYFKRLSKIKDTGKIIPGHGGLLDRIDGMIFAFPFSYLIFLNFIF